MSKEHDAVQQAIIAAPSAFAVWTWLSGLSVEKWLAVSGIVFIALQALYLAWRWRRDVLRERARTAFRHMLEEPETTDKAHL